MGRGLRQSSGVFLNGEGINSLDARGERVVDEFYLLFNADYEPLTFALPQRTWGEDGTVILDTTQFPRQKKSGCTKRGTTCRLNQGRFRCCAVFIDLAPLTGFSSTPAGFPDAAAMRLTSQISASVIFIARLTCRRRPEAHRFVVNHHQVNQELGGAEGHARLITALREQSLGEADIVPNHMAIVGEANPWWWDVLENGPSSRYPAYFDAGREPP